MKPVLIVVMGVSGSGKSTLAKHIAEQFSLTYVEADDFHDQQAKRMMASGIALTDEQRLPWIQRIQASLRQCFANGDSCVLAYSGLRRAHRQLFRELNCDICFLYLVLSQQALLSRLAQRKGHFFNPRLLDDQLASMQSANQEPDLFEINGEQSIEHILANCEVIIQEVIHAAK